MATLQSWIEDSYILMEADWTVEETLPLLEQVEVTHIIIRRKLPPRFDWPPIGYYLKTREDALALLHKLIFHDKKHLRESLEEALELHESDRTDESSPYTSPDAAPDQTVVTDFGEVVGFVDFTRSALSTDRGLEDMSFSSSQGGDRSTQEEASKLVPRSLKSRFPTEIVLEQTVPLLVWLSKEMGSPPPGTASLPLAIPLDSSLDVIVIAQGSLEVEGSCYESLPVATSSEVNPLVFNIKAVREGPGEIFIRAQSGGEYLGTIPLRSLVVPKSQTASKQLQMGSEPLIPTGGPAPDLYLIIQETNSNPPTVTVKLQSSNPAVGIDFKAFEPVAFRLDIDNYFQEFFHDVENLKTSTPDNIQIANLALEGKCVELFEAAFPEDLRVLLWSLKDRIHSIQILTDEPRVPWELCKLAGKTNGYFEPGPYLCEVFNITRWKIGGRAPEKLKISQMALVCPKDSGLANAPKERDYILSLGSGGTINVERIQATVSEVYLKMCSGKYDAWHFTGHGTFSGGTANRSAILLDQRQRLTPDFLNSAARNMGRAHPLVFLNACDIGQSGLGLTSVGGWAERFIHAGSAAFIGALWSIPDSIALDFAQCFYKSLLAGRNIGEAVREARLEIRRKNPGDPTWLAYTVYANPFASL